MSIVVNKASCLPKITVRQYVKGRALKQRKRSSRRKPRKINPKGRT